MLVKRIGCCSIKLSEKQILIFRGRRGNCVICSRANNDCLLNSANYPEWRKWGKRRRARQEVEGEAREGQESFEDEKDQLAEAANKHQRENARGGWRRSTNYLLLSTSDPELQQTTNISHHCIHLLPDVPDCGCSKCKYKSYRCKDVQT